MDVFTLFGANAIILIVMASGFLAAWLKRRDERYWPSWIGGNIALATALIFFMYLPEGTSWTGVIPHTLLVLGFGLRWRAAQIFTSGRATWLPLLAAICLTLALFALPSLFSAGMVFVLTNVILACQSTAIAAHFWRERLPGSPSSYGLFFAYGVMALSFGMRILEGLAFLDRFTSYLPHDGTLPLHLTIAVVHTSASGAFALSIAYERAALRLRKERDSARAKANTLGELAERDSLTGMLNRRAVEPRFTELQSAGFSTVAVIDLDRFKAINDEYGHACGDDVLRAAASALEPDEDCLVTRLGGEEFMLLLRGKKARERAERRRQAIPQRVAAEVAGLDRVVTASMGLVELPRRGMVYRSFEDLYASADRLLYAAKETGRNRTVAEKVSLFAGTPAVLSSQVAA